MSTSRVWMWTVNNFFALVGHMFEHGTKDPVKLWAWNELLTELELIDMQIYDFINHSYQTHHGWADVGITRNKTRLWIQTFR